MLSDYDIDLFSLTPVKCAMKWINLVEFSIKLFWEYDACDANDWNSFSSANNFHSNRIVVIFFLARFVIIECIQLICTEETKENKNPKLLYPYGRNSLSIESERWNEFGRTFWYILMIEATECIFLISKLVSITNARIPDSFQRKNGTKHK